jgi:hypothetical protein
VSSHSDGRVGSAGQLPKLKEMTEEKVRETLAGFPCLSRVFGEIIEARLGGSEPDSFILRMLETRHRMLEWWESRACKYLAIIDSPEDAITSLNSDLLGDARASSRGKFDGRLKDALAEVCAVVELSLRGGTDFKRIQPPPCQGRKVPDFEFLLKNDTGEPEPFCVEVKNFRAPVGIADFFKTLYDERAKSAPEILNRSVEISHYWDNTVTEDQEPIITECFSLLSSCDLPYETILTIDDEGKPIEVRLCVREGSGVSLSRGIGGDRPWGPFTKRAKFLSHAQEKIRKGVEQLRTRSDRKSLLVLNIESPDGSVESDLLLELRKMVGAESAGVVAVVFLLYYQWLE